MVSIRILAILILLSAAPLCRAGENYQPGPDSTEQDGVPRGEVTKYEFDQSRIFPGTVRDYWIYIPKQYDPAKPACLWVNQDGIQYRAPTVFDNLIARHEMPVTIGVFIMHGRVKSNSSDALDRFNRSYEYDGMGDNYARFLLEELLPQVEQKTARDGRPIHLSKDPNDRGIGGASSGAICAFTAAWERPDAFRRVFSSIGTFVDQRGGNVYPYLIRKYEPKPLRVYLQDGTADLNKVGGNWHLANEEMLSALEYAGYPVNHIWGDGGHDGKQATAIFPDAMRWLWADWPAAIKPGVDSQQPIASVIVPGEDWTECNGHQFPKDGANPLQCRNSQGGIYESDPAKKHIVFTPHDGRRQMVDHDSSFSRLCLTPDQSLLLASDPHSQFVYSFHINPDGSLADKQAYHHLIMADGAMESGARGMAVDTAGTLYVATRVGVQLCDQAGRVMGILSTPRSLVPSLLAFGGAKSDELYMVAGGKTFVRKLRVTGIRPAQPPVKPSAPSL